MLKDTKLKGKRIILYSADEPDKKANAVLLLALYAVGHSLPLFLTQTQLSFQMVVMRWSPADVLHPLSSLQLVSPSLLTLTIPQLTFYENSNPFEMQDTPEQITIYPTNRSSTVFIERFNLIS